MKNREIKFEIIWENLDEKIQKQNVTLDNLLLGAWELPSNRLGMIAKREWTGLKDKNGKEIYEGDIVRSYTHYYGNKKERQAIVEWQDDIENDSFGTPLTTGYAIWGGEWEVIGNIYENPELIK